MYNIQHTGAHCSLGQDNLHVCTCASELYVPILCGSVIDKLSFQDLLVIKAKLGHSRS